jgi:hypothetical protein
MRGRLPLFVLLVGALTFLASLFLPWRETTAPPFSSSNVQGLLTLFEGGHEDGWVSGAGDVAVLVVVAIVLATIAALRQPQLDAWLPIGSLAVALGYFAAAVAVEVRTLSGLMRTAYPQAPHITWAYGFYLGVASAGIALLGGLAHRRAELRRTPSGADAAALVLGIALLISFLLPWIGEARLQSVHGIEYAAALIAALGLILGARLLHGEGARRLRLPFAIATAILTGGAASSVPTGRLGHLYGAWIGVGCAAALVALEAERAWPWQVPVLPRGLRTLRSAAAAFLIVALFLPWQEGRHLNGVTYGGGVDGWYSYTGAAAGSLCLLLLAIPVVPALEKYVLDMVAAAVIFVSMLATAFREETFAFRIGYGAFVGIAAAGVLLVTVLVPVRPGRVDARRALVRAAPLAASVLCAAAVVVPLWFVLPVTWEFQASPLYGLLGVPGVLIALYLVRLWALRVQGSPTTGNRLTLLPLTLLTLPSLELIRFRAGDVIWGAVILLGLCLLLAVFGWIEDDGGLESFRVPDEVWRIDRLSEAES